VQASAQAAPAQSAAQGTPLSDEQRALGDRWAAVVEQLNASGAITALVRELAMQAQCVAIEDEGRSWRLRVERETLRNPAHRDRLQQALGTALGHPASIEVEAGAAQDTPARREAAAREARQREAESTIQNDPLVLQLMQQFKTARIVPGSIKPI
jgi:DNA polymerase-3 subunit gamma/tau